MTLINVMAALTIVVAVVGNPTADPTTESEMETTPTTASEELGHLKTAGSLFFPYEARHLRL